MGPGHDCEWVWMFGCENGVGEVLHLFNFISCNLSSMSCTKLILYPFFISFLISLTQSVDVFWCVRVYSNITHEIFISPPHIRGWMPFGCVKV